MLNKSKYLAFFIGILALLAFSELAINKFKIKNKQYHSLRLKIHSKNLVNRYVDEIKHIYNALNFLTLPDYKKSPELVNKARFYINSFVDDSEISLKAVIAIEPSGALGFVNPEKLFNAAEVSNIINQSETREYFLNSKKFKKPYMTPVLDTNLGYKGIAIIEAVYDDQKDFRGWVIYFIRYDKFIDKFITQTEMDNLEIDIKWQDAGKAEKYYSHNFNSKLSQYREIRKTRDVFQQKITFVLKFYNNLPSEAFYTIIWLARICMVLLAMSFLGILIAQIRLNKQKNKLELQQVLVNTVAHDIATPISILDLLLGRIKEKISETEYTRLAYGIERLKTILQKTREIQQNELHPKGFELQKESLSLCVSQSLNAFTEKLAEKNIGVSADIKDDVYVITNKDILMHNVLANIIDNAIKFSEEGSSIDIYAKKSHKKIILSIQDHGTGIIKCKLDKLNNQKRLVAGLGTSGEKGSGLGWIQIYYFITRLGAEVEIHSNAEKENGATGTRIDIHFKQPDPTKD